MFQNTVVFPSKTIVFVEGPAGSGKTTLLETMYQMADPTQSFAPKPKIRSVMPSRLISDTRTGAFYSSFNDILKLYQALEDLYFHGHDVVFVDRFLISQLVYECLRNSRTVSEQLIRDQLYDLPKPDNGYWPEGYDVVEKLRKMMSTFTKDIEERSPFLEVTPPKIFFHWILLNPSYSLLLSNRRKSTRGYPWEGTDELVHYQRYFSQMSPDYSTQFFDYDYNHIPAFTYILAQKIRRVGVLKI